MAFENRKLGRLPKKTLVGGPTLMGVYNGTLPSVPDSVDWTKPFTNWGMLGNDQYGNCVWAGSDHAVMDLNLAAGRPAPIMSLKACLQNYTNVAGFHEGPPASNDNGTVMIDAMKYWMNKGLILNDNNVLDHLGGFIPANPLNNHELKLLLDQFGGALVGVNLPESADDEFDRGVPWSDTTGTPTGGHCIWLRPFYNSQYIQAVTWGGTTLITWDWWNTYKDEVYGLVSTNWIGVNKLTPAGFTADNVEAVAKSLHAVFAA